MSELTMTIMRLGLLAVLWIFVFSIVGVLRSDLYGTHVRRRPLRSERADARAARAATAPTPASFPALPTPGRGRSSTPRKLVVTEGPLAGTKLPLRPRGTLIGRSPESALVLDDDYASGRHTRFFEEDGQWFAEDLGSTNGTFIDNRRINAAEPVQVGSTVRIGRTVIELTR